MVITMTPPINQNEHHGCLYEERFAALERENAELKARMDSKKEDIHSINKELAADRQRQIELIEKVTEVTVLLKAGQKQREESNESTDKQFKELKDTVESLQKELADTKEQLTDFVASQRSFRSTVVIGVPIIISLIIGVGLKFL